MSEAIEDILTGWPIGTGYYGTAVAHQEAREMAEQIETLFAAAVNESVNAVLGEIVADMQRAIETLRAAADASSDNAEYRRLRQKAEGVALSVDYVRRMRRP